MCFYTFRIPFKTLRLSITRHGMVEAFSIILLTGQHMSYWLNVKIYGYCFSDVFRKIHLKFFGPSTLLLSFIIMQFLPHRLQWTARFTSIINQDYFPLWCCPFVAFFLSIFLLPLADAAVIVSAPSNKTVVEYDTVTFFCNATSNPPSDIIWTQDENSTVLHHGETFTIENITRNFNGRLFKCTTRNNVTQNVQARAHLTVHCKEYSVIFWNRQYTKNLCSKKCQSQKYRKRSAGRQYNLRLTQSIFLKISSLFLSQS